MPSLFNPFEPLSFQPNICFLTGKHLTETHRVSAFPEWLMERYDLGKSTLVMLDGYRMKRADMFLPVSEEVKRAIDQLDRQTQAAFEQGYEAVKELPELTLFQWMARIFYGVLYQDFVYAIQKQKDKGEEFKPSALMVQKIKNLLLQLQSLVRPVTFTGFTPWTICCNPVKISKDIFFYEDETHHLNFSFSMNGFGVAACLQDNGEVGNYHRALLNKIGHTMLHAAQFAELYGWLLYANYLLREMPDYLIQEEDGALLFALPRDPHQGQPKFGKWEDKIFAQVLTNLWKPWGIPLKKIYTVPNSPLSYLIDETTFELIPIEKVNLPF